ncbi:Clp protease N-terminal domain-containing protein [Kineococcus sp. DHX-1]|uniref:Clp protease N-terminal domain-containing protein n=1 Tax=Kineococcus sp. DHX-1 TaxID=3349638 RepID=UPI0036D3585A
MFQRFTSEARDAVVAAQECARRRRSDHIGAEHLLLGLLDSTGPARSVLDSVGVDRDRLTEAVRSAPYAGAPADDADHLQELGIDLTEVRRRVEETFGAGALDVPARRRRGLLGRVFPPTHLRFERDAKKVLENSLRAALDLGDRHVGDDHVLLGLLADPRIVAVLRSAGTTLDLPTARSLVLQGRRRSA